MRENDSQKRGMVLPLPSFVLQPITAVIISVVHIYLAAGHLFHLFSGEVFWEHIWKGFGALGGAYVFAAIASRGFARKKKQQLQSEFG